MFCPKCGKINPDNSELCSGCSAVLHTEEEKTTPKKKKWLKTALVVIAVVIAAAIVIMLLAGCNKAGIPEESMTF